MTFCEKIVKGTARFCLVFNIYFYWAFLQQRSFSGLAHLTLLC